MVTRLLIGTACVMLALGGCSSDGESVPSEVTAACSSACELAQDPACVDLCKGGCSESACVEDIDGKPVDFAAVSEVICSGSTVNWISTSGGSSKTHACKY